MSGFRTYSGDTQWGWKSRRNPDYEPVGELSLYWEASCDPISDSYLPDEIDARQLFWDWISYLDQRDNWYSDLGEGWVPIYWYVAGESTGTFEAAPFLAPDYEVPRDEDFLTFYTWPRNHETGERLNWLRLPVQDKLWNDEHADKGGFIQEATSWKPAPYQPLVHVEVLRQTVEEG